MEPVINNANLDFFWKYIIERYSIYMYSSIEHDVIKKMNRFLFINNIFVFTICLSLVNSYNTKVGKYDGESGENDIIKHLPGLNYKINFKMYSGYISVESMEENSSSNLFYWLVPGMLQYLFLELVYFIFLVFFLFF